MHLNLDMINSRSHLFLCDLQGENIARNPSLSFRGQYIILLINMVARGHNRWVRGCYNHWWKGGWKNDHCILIYIFFRPLSFANQWINMSDLIAHWQYIRLLGTSSKAVINLTQKFSLFFARDYLLRYFPKTLIELTLRLYLRTSPKIGLHLYISVPTKTLMRPILASPSNKAGGLPPRGRDLPFSRSP